MFMLPGWKVIPNYDMSGISMASAGIEASTPVAQSRRVVVSHPLKKTNNNNNNNNNKKANVSPLSFAASKSDPGVIVGGSD